MTPCPKFNKCLLPGPPALSMHSLTACSICSLVPNSIVGSTLPEMGMSGPRILRASAMSTDQSTAIMSQPMSLCSSR
eukprot:CAMPEP_0201640508 /NCGR_PEP_ID=MMETSP0493-20130528/22067_1 /ASSEMBLY_ACC=CAM_ASM_000838 /TAXON_ID=420259 /ORGANISM="Thalassiosira gravida, Strain GMp14c1" /LENGTH=76 /DNA_ID=CAMNT_0048114229 /DNA_START=277 /DNA_END=507 /DNA_ORIENTATION=+